MTGEYFTTKLLLSLSVFLFASSTSAAMVEAHRWGDNCGLTPSLVPGETSWSGAVSQYYVRGQSWVTKAEKHTLVLHEGQSARISISGLVPSPANAPLYVNVISQENLFGVRLLPNRFMEVASYSVGILGKIEFFVTAGTAYTIPPGYSKTGVGRRYKLTTSTGVVDFCPMMKISILCYALLVLQDPKRLAIQYAAKCLTLIRLRLKMYNM